jgi:putative NADH-flavin reductase
MKVTIFGATGFSGKSILAETLKQGLEVTVLKWSCIPGQL